MFGEAEQERWYAVSLSYASILGAIMLLVLAFTGYSELSDEKWNQRKKIVSPEIISLGVSNSRISQLLKEFVDEGIIERKRGEGAK